MFQVDVLISTTSRGHVSRICDRHFKDALETCMTHPMFAWKSGGSTYGNVVGSASETWYFLLRWWRSGCEETGKHTGLSSLGG